MALRRLLQRKANPVQAAIALALLAAGLYAAFTAFYPTKDRKPAPEPNLWKDVRIDTVSFRCDPFNGQRPRPWVQDESASELRYMQSDAYHPTVAQVQRMRQAIMETVKESSLLGPEHPGIERNMRIEVPPDWPRASLNVCVEYIELPGGLIECDVSTGFSRRMKVAAGPVQGEEMVPLVSDEPVRFYATRDTAYTATMRQLDRQLSLILVAIQRAARGQDPKMTFPENWRAKHDVIYPLDESIAPDLGTVPGLSADEAAPVGGGPGSGAPNFPGLSRGTISQTKAGRR